MYKHSSPEDKTLAELLKNTSVWKTSILKNRHS